MALRKIEAQHDRLPNQPAVRQGRGMALESPQGAQIAQLEAMAEASPQAGKLAQLAAMVDNSQAAAAQRRMMGLIHDSPHMAAQRQQKEGDVAQRKPIGTYASAVPGTKGMQWDTKDTATHNSATVPSRSIAVMKEPGNGGTPSVNPPGWSWLQGRLGRLKGLWVRFHIINAQLGGPGNDTGNLVPTTVATNLNSGWRNVEDEAKKNANVTKAWTYLDVSLTYDNAFPDGIPKTVSGEWGSWDGSKWNVKNSSGTITQSDPSSTANGGYLPGSQIPKSHLKNYGAPNALRDEISTLIGRSYADQQAFDDAWNNEFAMTDEKYDKALSKFQGRCFVDEDDNISGPYIVLVKTG